MSRVPALCLLTALAACVEKSAEPPLYVVSLGSLDLGSARYDQDEFPSAIFSILSQDSRTLYVTPTGFTGDGAGYLAQDLENFSELSMGDSVDIEVSIVSDVLLWDSGSFEGSMGLEIGADAGDGTALEIEDQSVPITFSLACDLDGDGADADTTGGADCDDSLTNIGPDVIETCDGVDDDCDGLVDEGDASDALTWYLDSDDDDYGDRGLSTTACEKPDGYVSNSSDCDDGDEDINPGATEQCNFVDDDCDLVVDEDNVCE